MDKAIPNQINEFKQHIADERIELLNSFIDKLDSEKAENAKIRMQEKIEFMQNRTDYRMKHGIDIGGIIEYVVIPHDLVKVELNNGHSFYAFAVKEGRKTRYFYAEQYVNN